MLQIASGRLFHGPPGRENHIRGILHTNLSLYGEERVDTSVGALLATSSSRTGGALVLEMVERMEDGRRESGVLISRGADYYLDDFSAVVCFGLNVICSPYADLVDRLTRPGRRGDAPASLIKGVFDPHIHRGADDLAAFASFVNDLVRLPRKQYLAAFRAIQSYQDALHRLGDNREMAYALLVAAVEGLAQKFDGHRAKWPDLPDTKRKPIDAALKDAPEDVADGVRDAVLENEHVLLSRRFRDFALDHVEPSFFRASAGAYEAPASKSDLPVALREAYALRSKYLHVGAELPKLLSWGGGGDVMLLERLPILTFHGLSRLVRHVVMTFVARQPKLDHEPYDYRREERGIVQAEVASQYWLWDPACVTPTNGARLLEAFLAELAQCLLEPTSKLTNLEKTLAAVATVVPTLKRAKQRPFVALYLLYNSVLRRSEEPDVQAFAARYRKVLDGPSSESLVAHLVVGQVPDWPIAAHRAATEGYLEERKGGVRFPRVFEAALLLELAERYRAAGHPEEARTLIADAVDTCPGHRQLLDFEGAWSEDAAISWGEILLPARAPAKGPDGEEGVVET